MSLLKWKGLKIVAIFVLFFFSWTFAGIFDIAYAVDKLPQSNLPQSTTNPRQEQPPKPEIRFQKAIEEIEGILEEPSADRVTKTATIKGKRAEIDELDKEIKKQFAETEKKLKDAGLPDEILQRHHKFVKHYEDNLNELKVNLDSIEKAKGRAADNEIEKVKKHLQRVRPPKRHIPLDPNKLPHRTPKIERREPRLKKKDFERDFLKPQKSEEQRKPILVATNGSLRGLLPANDEQDTANLVVAQATTQPTDSDQAETIEVQFTPEIIAKAQELGNNPVKIYNRVRNNIEFVPTYGSIQGAHMTLLTKQGNAFDTASLLIALLRASNIPARYVYGTIEVPIDKVMNWVGGFTDAKSAVDFIASGGIPITAVISGGKITKVWMEHVWVEAWIDYIPSRGGRHKTGQGDTWIPLDASYKQYAYTEGIDIKTAVPFDAQTFINQVQATAIIDTTNNSVSGVDSLYIQQQAQDYNTRVRLYMTQNYPNATVEDFLGKSEIVKQEFAYLLGTLPHKLLVTGAKYAEIPDNLRHKLSFSVIKGINDSDLGTPINITRSLPELAGKKITLSYSPAALADESVIKSYLPKPHPDGTPIQPSELPTSLPSYLINLKPELRIDGAVVATGTSVGMGNTETFNMTFTNPAVGPDVITNEIQAGNYLGIALDLGMIPQEQLVALKANLDVTKAKLQAQDISALTKDDILGDLLYTTALVYHAMHDFMKYVVSKTTSVVAITLPSVAIFSLELKTNFFFGIPISASAGGLVMDADRLLTIVKALDGSKDRQRQFMLSLGINGSVLEHSAPEQLFSTPDKPVHGISAVTALKMANDQGIPLYTINQSNINSILPQLQLDSETISDIQNAVSSGKIVTVSKTNISFNGWIGCGYIIIDPNTGSGAYMLSGGLDGGRLDWLDWVGLIGLLVAIVAIGVICVLSGICAIIAAALVSAFTAVISALSSFMLWLAAWGTTAYIALSDYLVLEYLFLIITTYFACVQGSPTPPDENTLICTLIFGILAALTKYKLF